MNMLGEGFKLLFSTSFICLALLANSHAQVVPAVDPATDNLARRVSECDSLILVCDFKREWIPPEKVGAKGRMVYYARIVGSLKGSMKINKTIRYGYYIEDAPRWLGPFVADEAAEMSYLFILNKNVKTADDGSYILEFNPDFSFKYEDPKFSPLLKTVLPK